MKRYDSELVDDVEELLESVIVEEATAQIWKSFESALNQLDPESRKLIETYLDGTNTAELSKVTELPESTVNQWIHQIKKQLQQNIRKEIRVKQ